MSKPRGPSGPGVSGTRFTEERRQHYLDIVAETGEKKYARQQVGVCRNTVNNHKRKDPEFAEAEEEALCLFRARIEVEIHRRAMIGVKKPVFYRGTKVGEITEFSDRLLIEYARRHIPEYRHGPSPVKETEHRVADDLAAIRNLSEESQDLLQRIIEIEQCA